MASDTQYRLKPKYENIPLEFGSAILVNNNNITNEYAKKLLARPNGERFFAHIPAENEHISEQTKQKRRAASAITKEKSLKMKYSSENLENTAEE